MNGYAGNLSYHLKSRPKWDRYLLEAKKNKIKKIKGWIYYW